MEKKKGIIITGITLLLLLVVGVTYAFFTYESGTKSDIVTGQIYMNYEETSTISLTGVFPETKAQALARQDENGVFEFTITGRNTSKYPVYYEIDLLEGGVMTGKTEQSTRLLPEHVRIYLERDGEPLVDGVTFKDWNNRRIYVDTVPANQTSNIEHKYKLRMWIDENVTISDTDPDADYTTTEWNDAYTSLKVRVVGDFEEKEVATDASCFAYNVVEVVDEIILDTSEEKVNTCKAYLMDAWGEDNSDAQDGYQSYCEGTGTVYGGYSLEDDIVSGELTDEQIQSLGVVTLIMENVIEITNYDETCGTNVIIPSTIEGLPVTIIAPGNIVSGNGYFSAFNKKNITSVKFPNTLRSINSSAFSNNSLSEVIIPDSVAYIGGCAFANNPLVTVNVKGNPELGFESFMTTSDEYLNGIVDFQLFQYGGTCEQLNSYEKVFTWDPNVIITTDTNSCEFTNIPEE